jgi:indolepyruvate ferredoxin oxidoreductase, beta subunit
VNQINIIITGVGGQGVVSAGYLIGKAVTTAGLNAVMSEIHGMSQRGGVVSVDVRIGNVYGPIIPEGTADLLIGFEAMETLRAMKRVNMKTTVLMNTERIVPVMATIGGERYPEAESAAAKLEQRMKELYTINALSLALEAGNANSTNVVLVGAAYAAGFVPVPLSILEESVREVFPERTRASNLKALSLGMTKFESMKAGRAHEESATGISSLIST